MKKILIAEDNTSISDLVKIHLEMEGYNVHQTYDGLATIEYLYDNKVDLVILDVMLPIMTGFEILPRITSQSVPVIMLTAKGEIEDKIQGFQLGADDYLTKPFESVELMMRVNAVLKRTSVEQVVSINDIQINLINRKVLKNNQEVTLTIKEYDLLSYLIHNRGLALSRETLLEKVWGYSHLGHSRTIDIHIQRLRSKLDLNVATIFKYGYRLEL